MSENSPDDKSRERLMQWNQQRLKVLEAKLNTPSPDVTSNPEVTGERNPDDDITDAYETVVEYHVERAVATAVKAAIDDTNLSEAQVLDMTMRVTARLFGFSSHSNTSHLLELLEEQSQLISSLYLELNSRSEER